MADPIEALRASVEAACQQCDDMHLMKVLQDAEALLNALPEIKRQAAASAWDQCDRSQRIDFVTVPNPFRRETGDQGNG